MYKTGDTTKVVAITAGAANTWTFTMPAYPVTIEAPFQNTATGLTALKYKVATGTETPVTGFATDTLI